MSYSALMNIFVDTKEAAKGLNNLDKRLENVEKSSKKSNKSLKSLENSLDRIKQAVNKAVAPIVKMEKIMTKLAGGSLSKYRKLINQLRTDNKNLESQIQKLNTALKKQQGHIANLQQRMQSLSRQSVTNATATTQVTKATAKATKATDDLKKKQMGLGDIIKRNEYLFYQLQAAVIGFIKVNLIGSLIRITDQFILIQNRIRLVNQDTSVFRANFESVKRIALDL